LWSQKPEGSCCEIIGDNIKHRPTLGMGAAAGLRREDVKLREGLNKALGEIMGDGTYSQINDKYFPFPLEERPNSRVRSFGDKRFKRDRKG
jgi:ABC-type amino acid transport substrate-binding protein